jgi:hypothetical protein
LAVDHHLADIRADRLWADQGRICCRSCGQPIIYAIAHGEPIKLDARPDWSKGHIHVTKLAGGALASIWTDADRAQANRAAGVPFYTAHDCEGGKAA